MRSVDSRCTCTATFGWAAGSLIEPMKFFRRTNWRLLLEPVAQPRSYISKQCLKKHLQPSGAPDASRCTPTQFKARHDSHESQLMKPSGLGVTSLYISTPATTPGQLSGTHPVTRQAQLCSTLGWCTACIRGTHLCSKPHTSTVPTCSMQGSSQHHKCRKQHLNNTVPAAASN